MAKASTFVVELDGDDFVVGSLRLKAGHTPSANQRVITETEHTQVRSGAEGLHVVKSNYKLPRWKHTGTLEDQTSKDNRSKGTWQSTEVNVSIGATEVIVELKIAGRPVLTELNFCDSEAMAVTLVSDGFNKRKWLMDVDTSVPARYRLDNCTELVMQNSLLVVVS